MKEHYINIDFENNTIKTDLTKLVQNDYNSIKINFEIDKEYDKALFELKYPDKETAVQMVIKDNELILPKGILYQAGDYEFEISIYSADSKLTHFKTNIFEVREELVKDSENVINDDRYPVLSDLINDVNKSISDVESFKNEVRNDEKLKGPKGDPFLYEDFTEEQLESLKGKDGKDGAKGDPFTYEDFTEEQLNSLKQSIADSLDFNSYDDTEIKNRLKVIEDTLFIKATARTSKSANGTITLIIEANRELPEIEGYTLSEDKLILSKTLTENIGGEVSIELSEYKTLNLTYEAPPELTVKVSNVNSRGQSTPTNKPVTVTITSNKELKEIEGWNLSEDKKVLTKEFIEIQKQTEIKIFDLNNNSTITKYKVSGVCIQDLYIANMTLTTENDISTLRVFFNDNVKLDKTLAPNWNSIGGNITSLYESTSYGIDDLESSIIETFKVTDIYTNENTIIVKIYYENNELKWNLVDNCEHKAGKTDISDPQNGGCKHKTIWCSVCGEVMFDDDIDHSWSYYSYDDIDDITTEVCDTCGATNRTPGNIYNVGVS